MGGGGGGGGEAIGGVALRVSFPNLDWLASISLKEGSVRNRLIYDKYCRKLMKEEFQLIIYEDVTRKMPKRRERWKMWQANMVPILRERQVEVTLINAED